MRKFCVLLAALMMFAAGLPGAALAEYYNEGHTGDSEADAYIIDSVDDLKQMRDRVNAGTESTKYYKLAADLDITAETEWMPIGSRDFSGVFDGQNHTIKVNIIGRNAASLFSILSGTIKNLKVSGTIKGYFGG